MAYSKKALSKELKMMWNSKKEDFLQCGTLGATLLRNMLPVKGVLRAGKGTIRAREAITRAVQDV